jgi:hypothetical protein
MKKLLLLIITVLSCLSCDDYLDIKTVGQVIPTTVEDYRSFLTSAYSITISSKVLTSFRSDELALSSQATGVEQYEDVFIWNDLNPSPLMKAYPYASFYNIIFYTNHIINSKDKIEGNQEAVDQLVGEAYALRAMQYFELINLYAEPFNSSTASTDAGVPVTTIYETGVDYPIATVEEVYRLILSDLEEAETLINIEQQTPGLNYRFSQWALQAFKARVYLYRQEWQKALDYADAALAIGSELQDLNSDVNIMPSEYNSVESILALETVATFDLVNNASISDELILVYNPEEDLRFNLYFSKNSDGRYRSNKREETRFKVSYRTSEMYFIRAEALARLQKPDLAKEALLALVKQRYTPEGFEAYILKVLDLTPDELITEIIEERRREFAIEGHRWNDLRRTTQPEITKVYDGESYTLKKNDERYVIPFPRDAVINNPDL